MVSTETPFKLQTWPHQSAETMLPQILPKDQGHYRSKIFNTCIGINPLVAAASPLFSLGLFLLENPQPTEDAYTLFQELTHEIKSFENNAKMQRYRSDTILVTRFLLCAFLDDLIQQVSPQLASNWKTHSLLMFFHQAEDDGERFFVILDKLSKDPELHIDVLELIYLCLKFGYLGKYRELTEGREWVNQLTHRLFDCIRHERGELKKELHVASAEKIAPPVMKMVLPLWLIISFTVAVLLTMYSSFSYMLGNDAEALYQELNTLVVSSSQITHDA